MSAIDHLLKFELINVQIIIIVDHSNNHKLLTLLFLAFRLVSAPFPALWLLTSAATCIARTYQPDSGMERQVLLPTSRAKIDPGNLPITFSGIDIMKSDSPYKSLRAKHKVFNLRHPEVRELLYSLRYGLRVNGVNSGYGYSLQVIAKLSGYSPSYLSCWFKNEKKRREQGNLPQR